jgi:hypothetical protein
MDLFDRLKEARAKQDPAVSSGRSIEKGRVDVQIEEYERLYGDVPIRGRNLRVNSYTMSSAQTVVSEYHFIIYNQDRPSYSIYQRRYRMWIHRGGRGSQGGEREAPGRASPDNRRSQEGD